MRLVYVVSRWGQPTETFVRREVSAAAAAGNQLAIVSLKQPLVASAPGPVISPRGRAAITSATMTILMHPVRCLRSLARIVRGARRSTIRSHLGAAYFGFAAASAVRDVDVVHAHFAWVSATAADVMATMLNAPLSIFAHAHDLYEARCVDSYLIDKLRRADAVFVESDRIRDDVELHYGCRAIVARVGVPESFVVASAALKEEPRRHILSVGTLTRKKGHDVLLEAVAQLPDDVTCSIAGEGPARGELEAIIERNSLQGRVRLLGAVPTGQIPALLDAADVFCLASRVDDSGDRDGVPNVLIEAMARGLPAVSTDVSGIPDLLTGRGLIVPTNDALALAEALRRLLLDADLAAVLAGAGLAHVREQYMAERNWSSIEGVLRSLR